MARLASSGFELNSVSTNVETVIVGSPTIVTSPVRSGTYAGSVVPVSSAQTTFNLQESGGTLNHYYRFYLYIGTLPGSTNAIMAASANGSGSSGNDIRLTTAGALQLFVNNAQIGSSSSALNTGQWYRIEVHFDFTPASGSRVAEAKIDGVTFATSTTIGTVTNTTGGNYIVGANLRGSIVTATGQWYFDDVAINDTTGSFQTGYPGAGKIIHLRPNAAGDSNGYLVTNGGTAGAANNFTRVNEVTPDDATTYNASVLLNAEDLYNCDNSGIGASDTVNVVSVGGRFADLVAADGGTAFKFEIEKTGSGTKTQSAAIVANSTSFKTNATAAPFVYPIITYQDPDSSAWTQTTLDSMQIGMILTAAGTRTAAVTTIWALVDYTPSTDDSTNVSDTSTTSENIDVIRNSSRDTLVSDTATTSETISRLVTNNINVNDPTTISEAVDVIRANARDANVNDSTSTSESLTELVISFLSKSDTTVTSESVTVSIAGGGTADSINTSDTATTSESYTVFIPTLFVSKSDTTTTSESLTMRMSDYSLSVSDTTTTSESQKLIVPTYFISTSDNTVTSEALDVLRAGARNINKSDTTVTSESLTVTIPAFILPTDSTITVVRTGQINISVSRTPAYNFTIKTGAL